MNKVYTVDEIKSLFPCDSDYFYPNCSYEAIIGLSGSIVFEYRDDDYQGETTCLIRNNETGDYCLYNYSWGSCAGCDSLQGCGDYNELTRLINHMLSRINWKPYSEIIKDINNMQDDINKHKNDEFYYRGHTDEFLEKFWVWYHSDPKNAIA